ncbi:MAG TPA: hypothetical protein VK845_10550 [Gemmatimonadales bacterium]|nr:hypothetical protein [Gemmatimonadales bacterium]
MCGIVGYVGHREGTVSLATVRGLLDRLAHRGPDDLGVLVDCPREGWTASIDRESRRTSLPRASTGASSEAGSASATLVLGHRRLAIIDISSAGHQPMLTADGRYAIVFNGEIYNYVELRDELSSRGHRFRSRSDTEVLLAGYAEWGRACLPRLVGMFPSLFGIGATGDSSWPATPLA